MSFNLRISALLWVASALCSLGVSACSKSEASPAAKQEAASAATPAAALAPSAAVPAPEPSEPTGPALRIAYSDWPGWVAWDIADKKGWFKEEGIAVELKWFEYAPSMEADSAGK